MAVTQEDTNIIKMATEDDALTATKLYKINFLYWYCPSAAAAELILVTDEADNEVWACAFDGVTLGYICPVKNSILGLKVPDLDTGALYVYLAATYPGQY